MQEPEEQNPKPQDPVAVEEPSVAQASACRGTSVPPAEATAVEPAEAAAEPSALDVEAAPDVAGSAAEAPAEQPTPPLTDAELTAVLEAIVYVTEEPATPAQISAALGQPEDRVKRLLDELAAAYAGSAHGVMIREVAGGYKMATKPEHHETIRAFVKSLKPPMRLSLAALETLATNAYKQPNTAPEIMEIRGVQGAGVLKTLLDRKLIHTSGRKNVIGRPILYRTTKEFLVQFGLKDLSELPTLKEFEELRRLAVSDEMPAPAEPADVAQASARTGTSVPPVEAEAEAAEPQAAADNTSAETETATAAPEPQAVEPEATEPAVAKPEAAEQEDTNA